MKVCLVLMLCAAFLIQIGVSFGQDFIVIGSDAENGNETAYLVDMYWAECDESWSCTGWSACSLNLQARTCTDANNCGTNETRPALTQSCTSDDGGGGGPGTSDDTEANVTTESAPIPEGGILTNNLIIIIIFITLLIAMGIIAISNKLNKPIVLLGTRKK